MARPALTVVIPAYNEAGLIGGAVRAARSLAAGAPQVVVVDGGSGDETGARAAAAGARVLTVRGGRAAQLNAGAAAAAADTLLFLHADTRPPQGYDVEVAALLAGEAAGGRGWFFGGRRGREVVGGAFRLRVDGRGWALRVVEAVVNWRSRRMSLPYGDQGLFLRRGVFEAVGGYPEMPFMEDYEMSRRLARVGALVISKHAVLTSARRWQTLGVFRTSVINQCVVLGYHLGVPVTKLASWYRGALSRAAERQRPPACR